MTQGWFKIGSTGASNTKLPKITRPRNQRGVDIYTNLTSFRCCHRVGIPGTGCLLSHCFSKCLTVFHMKFVHMYAQKWHLYTHVLFSHTFCILSLYFDQAIKYVPAKCTYLKKLKCVYYQLILLFSCQQKYIPSTIVNCATAILLIVLKF